MLVPAQFEFFSFHNIDYAELGIDYTAFQNKLYSTPVENGKYCCPNDDSLPMKHDGTSTRKNGLKRYKFVCPKIKCVKDASTGKYHRHCICDNPCTGARI